jgi:hypothetical protein
METKTKRLSGITLGTALIMAFVLVQPTMQQANAVGVEGLPAYDDCTLRTLYEDPISMNTVRSKSIVKTIHAEKEVFDCHLNQGGLDVIVDVTTVIEIYEDIDDREVIESSAISVTCIKDEDTATVIDCESLPVPSVPVPVDPTSCQENTDIEHPQEMNTVTKGKIAKTIEAQKEVFNCYFAAYKKVDIILFTSIYEDLSTQTVEEVQFYSMRCVILESDFEDDLRDATVETCQFSSIEN